MSSTKAQLHLYWSQGPPLKAAIFNVVMPRNQQIFASFDLLFFFSFENMVSSEDRRVNLEDSVPIAFATADANSELVKRRKSHLKKK